MGDLQTKRADRRSTTGSSCRSPTIGTSPPTSTPRSCAEGGWGLAVRPRQPFPPHRARAPRRGARPRKRRRQAVGWRGRPEGDCESEGQGQGRSLRGAAVFSRIWPCVAFQSTARARISSSPMSGDNGIEQLRPSGGMASRKKDVVALASPIAMVASTLDVDPIV